MINIDSDLAHATTVASDWSREAAHATASTLAISASARIDWDDGAGEQWLRILKAHRVIALVSVQVPLVIAEGPRRTADAPERVVVIHVSDFDEPEIAASKETLASAFGSSERFHILDTVGFSVNDLWYATV